MASSFPGALDSFTTKSPGNQVQSAHMNYVQDAIAAIQNRLGISDLSLTSSVDYILRSTSSVDPGHKHSNTSLNSLDEAKVTGTSILARKTIADTITGDWQFSNSYTTFGSPIRGTQLVLNFQGTGAAPNNYSVYLNRSGSGSAGVYAYGDTHVFGSHSFSTTFGIGVVNDQTAANHNCTVTVNAGSAGTPRLKLNRGRNDATPSSVPALTCDIDSTNCKIVFDGSPLLISSVYPTVGSILYGKVDSTLGPLVTIGGNFQGACTLDVYGTRGLQVRSGASAGVVHIAAQFVSLMGGGNTPNSGYLSWGDNTGWRFRMGTTSSGVFSNRFTFSDLGNAYFGFNAHHGQNSLALTVCKTGSQLFLTNVITDNATTNPPGTSVSSFNTTTGAAFGIGNGVYYNGSAFISTVARNSLFFCDDYGAFSFDYLGSQTPGTTASFSLINAPVIIDANTATLRLRTKLIDSSGTTGSSPFQFILTGYGSAATDGGSPAKKIYYTHSGASNALPGALFVSSTNISPGSGGALLLGCSTRSGQTISTEAPFVGIAAAVGDASTYMVGDMIFLTRTNISTNYLTERMRLTLGAGFLGINNPAPLSYLSVGGAYAMKTYIHSASGDLSLSDVSLGSIILVTGSGAVNVDLPQTISTDVENGRFYEIRNQRGSGTVTVRARALGGSHDIKNNLGAVQAGGTLSVGAGTSVKLYATISGSVITWYASTIF